MESEYTNYCYKYAREVPDSHRRKSNEKRVFNTLNTNAYFHSYQFTFPFICLILPRIKIKNKNIYYYILGTLKNLQKLTISFSLSVCMEQFHHHRTEFCGV